MFTIIKKWKSSTAEDCVKEIIHMKNIIKIKFYKIIFPVFKRKIYLTSFT